MDGIKMTSFTGADLFQALIGTMSNVLDMSRLATNVDEAFDFEKSIDERVFSDFGIDGSEKDYKQDALAKSGDKYHGHKNNKNDETVDQYRDGIERIREQQEEFAKSLTERQFTDADFDAAVISALQNWDEFSKGMPEDKKALFKDKLERYYESNNPAEKEQLKAEMNEISPDKYEQLEIDAERNYQIENPDAYIKISETVELSSEKIDSIVEAPVVTSKPASLDF